MSQKEHAIQLLENPLLQALIDEYAGGLIASWIDEDEPGRHFHYHAKVRAAREIANYIQNKAQGLINE